MFETWNNKSYNHFYFKTSSDFKRNTDLSLRTPHSCYIGIYDNIQQEYFMHFSSLFRIKRNIIIPTKMIKILDSGTGIICFLCKNPRQLNNTPEGFPFLYFALAAFDFNTHNISLAKPHYRYNIMPKI